MPISFLNDEDLDILTANFRIRILHYTNLEHIEIPKINPTTLADITTSLY